MSNVAMSAVAPAVRGADGVDRWRSASPGGRGVEGTRNRRASRPRPRSTRVRACAAGDVRSGARSGVRSGEVALPRLTSRGRLVVLVAAFVVGVVVVTLVGQLAAAAVDAVHRQVVQVEAPVPGESTTSVVVRPGDTAWSIASRVAPDADPRRVVDRVRELNGLERAGDLRPGQRLVVPARVGLG